MTAQLQGKLAMIIGGSGGVGRALVRECLEHGMSVIATYCHNPESLLSVSHPALTTMRLDFGGGASAVKQFAAQLTAPPDLLIQAATPSLLLKRFESLNEGEIEAEILHSLTGPLLLTHAMLRIMKAGTIVQLLSQATSTHPPRMALYTLAKAALEASVKSISKEVSSRGVRVLGVSPSFIETGLLAPFPPKLLELERERRPNQKLLQPEEVAERILAIVGDSNTYPGGDIITLE